MEELLNGRFVQEQVAPTILNAHRWQVLIFFLCAMACLKVGACISI
jgi:hypothetical protein